MPSDAVGLVHLVELTWETRFFFDKVWDGLVTGWLRISSRSVSFDENKLLANSAGNGIGCHPESYKEVPQKIFREMQGGKLLYFSEPSRMIIYGIRKI